MQWNDYPLAELKQYQPPLTAQPDFDAHWQQLTAEAQQGELALRTEPVNYPLSSVHVSRLSFAGFRNSRIHAVLVEPLERKPDSPVAVRFHGYNSNSAQVSHGFAHALAGRACLLLETRGQTLASPDHNNYPTAGAAGWLTQGILDKNNNYYTNVVMDCYRAVEALKAHYQNSHLPVLAEGVSQGGGLALMTTAVHSNVRAVAADVPFLTHYRRSVKLAGNGPYAEVAHFFKMQDPLHQLETQVYQTLSYVDAMNHAARIKVPALMSVGLEDDICPPSSAFAAFNHLKGDKQLRIYPDFGHGGFTRQEEEKIAFYQHLFG